jgi:4'-phosphopantetheinyl transferase
MKRGIILVTRDNLAVDEKQTPTSAAWGAPSDPLPPLAGGEVHLRRVCLRSESERHWRGLLTAEEQRRAGRFSFPADRLRFTVTRTALRVLLGRYLGATPESLAFEYNPLGKPALVPAQNSRRIAFNVSHSGWYSLLGFGIDVSLGVDVEALRGGRTSGRSPAQCFPRASGPGGGRCLPPSVR